MSIVPSHAHARAHTSTICYFGFQTQRLYREVAEQGRSQILVDLDELDFELECRVGRDDGWVSTSAISLLIDTAK